MFVITAESVGYKPAPNTDTQRFQTPIQKISGLDPSTRRPVFTRCTSGFDQERVVLFVVKIKKDATRKLSSER